MPEPETDDRFLFAVEGLPPGLRVVRFAGMEGLCELFRVELTFASEDGTLESDEVLGRPALLTLLAEDGEPRHVHGIVSRFEVGESRRKVTFYRATLVPAVFRLQHRHDCRIFQHLSTPEIVERVLSSAGLALDRHLRRALSGAYRPREYCVQYRESDWAFVSRLLEEEGIPWYFEHHADRHVLVLDDHSPRGRTIPGGAVLPYRPSLGALTGGAHLARFEAVSEIQPGRVTVRDYDFQKPGLLLEGSAGADADAALEVYDYPGVYEAPGRGQEIARIRLEEWQSQRRIGRGESACERLLPGHTFTLADHPRGSLNLEWLVTHLEYEGFEPWAADGGGQGEEQRYENRFQCIPASVVFRPPQHTPRPVMRGVQTAVVVGPTGEEIHTDRFGRVKVQFHWDRQGKRDDRSSCWLRVSSAWAGAAWGAMHIPRVGQEVIVDFLEGDPDRPLVVGRVYHGTNLSPYPLPEHRTVSTLRSSSTPGGDGSNELRFEDKKGSEEVYLHAQKDLDVVVEHDAKTRVGHDRAVVVGADHTERVGHDRTRAVANDEAVTVGGSRSVDVGGDQTATVGGNLLLTVERARTESVGENASEMVGGSISIKTGAQHSLDAGTDVAVRAGGSSIEEVALDKHLKSGEKVVVECGASRIEVDKSGKITIRGSSVAIVADGPVQLNGRKIAVSSSGEVTVEATGKVNVKGSGAMSIDASGTVVLRGTSVGIN